jgi:hypothetical protein
MGMAAKAKTREQIKTPRICKQVSLLNQLNLFYFFGQAFVIIIEIRTPVEGSWFKAYNVIDMIVDAIIVEEAKREETICYCA